VIEACRTADTAFKKLQILIRAYSRVDVQLARTEHFWHRAWHHAAERVASVRKFPGARPRGREARAGSC
jgi:hypothetical protein